jgi:hypothetical protein
MCASDWRRLLRRVSLCLISTVVLASAAVAQEFQPYTDAKITVEQWQSYLDEVEAKLGTSKRTFPDEHLMVFEDGLHQMYLAFTMPGHPAHPAWVTRRVVDQGDEVGTQQIGYFAGDEQQFAALYESYRELTGRMRGELEREQPPEAQSAEARALIEELTQDYLVAHDAQEFERAYAMLTPSMQEHASFDEWRGMNADSLARVGKPEGHDILKITWYQDPPQGQLPGTYAAVDLKCRYEKLSVCSEVVIFHRGKDGRFRVMRHEQNTLDSKTMTEMCKTREHLKIEFSPGNKVEITCPKRAGSGAG